MKSRSLLNGILVLLVSMLAACQAVNPTPTPPTPPTSTQPTPTSSPAASPTPASVPLIFPVAGWEGVKLETICLDVNEQYSEELAYSTAEIHREKAALLLRELGFQPLAASQACDAKLEVSLGYTVDSTTYESFNGGSSFDCITGASFGGSMLLSIADRLPLHQDFNSALGNAPAVITDGCPDQAQAFDSGWNQAFLENLSHLMGPHVITRLYHSEDKAVRNTALTASEAFGPEDMDVLPQVIQALKEHRSYAGQIGAGLQKMGPDAQLAAQEVVPGLVESLKTNRKNLPPEGIDPAMFYLSDIETIGKFGPAAGEAVPVLLEILEDPNAASMQLPVITTLGEIGPGAAEATPELMELTSDPFIGSEAAEALGKIGRANPEVLSFLIEKAKDKTSSRTGMAGLAQMAPSADLVKALTEIYEDPDMEAYTRSQAVEALGTMAATSAEALQVIIAASADNDQGITTSALIALGTLGPVSPDILPALKKALSRSNDFIQMAAAEALGSFGPGAAETIPTLITMIKSPKQVSLARLGAVSALGGIGQASPEVVSTLAGALKTAPAEAAAALEQLGPAARSSVPALIQALHEENANPELYENQLPFVRALVAITGEYHGFKAEDWQTWWDAQPKE
jgi:HEAT repeat protein